MYESHKARAAFSRAAERWVLDAAEELLERSRNDADPTGGPLFNSGRIEKVVWQGDLLVVAVKFGGRGSWGDVPYGASQHKGSMTYERNGNLVRWVVEERPQHGKPRYVSRNVKALPPVMHELGRQALRRELVG